MLLLYVKSLHIIFIVTWFAGLFYIVRLFIYQTEALGKQEPERGILSEQFKIMAKRLWFGITWPSAILTLIFGTWLLVLMPGYLQQGFMQVKLAFVLLLYVYQFFCQNIYVQLQNGEAKWTSNQLRVWNEVATVFLVAIIFLIVLKNSVDMLWGLVGLVLFSGILMIAIRIYKSLRQKEH